MKLTEEEKKELRYGDFFSYNENKLVIIKNALSLNESIKESVESYKNGEIDLEDVQNFILSDIRDILLKNQFRIIQRNKEEATTQ